MANKEYVLTMARYNCWQNSNLFEAANTLSDQERRLDRGAFFKSIHETFSHILWADQIWMSRFSNSPEPRAGIKESSTLFNDWHSLEQERHKFDQVILNWAETLSPQWFEGSLRWYSGAIGQEVEKPKTRLSIQLFNHQTHHRGQIHAMLTAAGARPNDTDVPFMPEHYG